MYLTLAIAVTLLGAPQPASGPRLVSDYLPAFVRYASHAQSIWHATPQGGYWGDGLSDGNGGIRGTSNLTLATAMLVRAYDKDWLNPSQRQALEDVGLDRAGCIDRIRCSWRYLAGSHVTGGGVCPKDKKAWGPSWQSSLWVGASGLAALVVWDDLDDALRRDIERVLVAEADAKLDKPPRNGTPGNTAAEENGWDTHAPAVAAALFPHHPNAARWLRAAQLLAVNTFSMAQDRQSTTRVGSDRTADVVTTTNLAADFTLDNHGFFHPSYLKVSIQELGEAWLLLALGDRRHGTHQAEELRPYAMHHVEDVWKRVLAPLVLPDGDLAFPSGQDWNLHMPSNQSFFAYVATAVGDPRAAAAERRGLGVLSRQMTVAPPGRLLAESNLEWWWEPIVLKRCATAMLHLELARGDRAAPDPQPLADSLATQTVFWPEAKVLVHRTPRYFASLSLRKTPTALVLPLGPRHLERPYTVTPRVGSILPAGQIVDFRQAERPDGTHFTMKYAQGVQATMVATDRWVLWVSSSPLGPVAIENDLVASSDGRTVASAGGMRTVPPLEPVAPFAAIDWINVNDRLGMVAPGGFEYRPAGKLTRRSAAEDLVVPSGAGAATPGGRFYWLLSAPCHTADQTRRLASLVRVTADDTRLVFEMDGQQVEIARSK